MDENCDDDEESIESVELYPFECFYRNFHNRKQRIKMNKRFKRNKKHDADNSGINMVREKQLQWKCECNISLKSSGKEEKGEPIDWRKRGAHRLKEKGEPIDWKKKGSPSTERKRGAHRLKEKGEPIDWKKKGNHWKMSLGEVR